MKKILAPKLRSRLRPLLTVAALFALNTFPAFAQSTSFSSTDLRTGISNSLAVIMMFGFVLGISSVIYGGFAIRRGDVDQARCPSSAVPSSRRPRRWSMPSTKSSASIPTARSASALSNPPNQLRADPTMSTKKRTSPDRHQCRVRFQRPHLGFGRRSLLVAHRRHRAGIIIFSSCWSSLTYPSPCLLSPPSCRC